MIASFSRALLLLILVTSSFFESAHAETGPEYFRRAVYSILDAARDASVKEFKGLDLEKIRREVDTLKIEYQEYSIVNFTDEHNEDASKRRIGGHYKPGYISFCNDSLYYLKDSNIFPALALHETLGALGYSDRNYERSLALYFYIRAPKSLRTISFSPTTALGASTPLFVKEGGGGTHAGGGGDALSLLLKYDVMRYFEQKSGNLSPAKFEKKWIALASKLQVLQIEPYEGLIIPYIESQKETHPYFMTEGKWEDGTFRIVYSTGEIIPHDPANRKVYESIIQYLYWMINKLPPPPMGLSK